MSSTIPWQSWAAVSGFLVGIDYRNPHFTFLCQIDEWFPTLEVAVPEESRAASPKPRDGGVSLVGRGAVWTYLTSDQPFGAWTERFLRSILRRIRGGGT